MVATPNTNGKARLSLGDFLDREVTPALTAAAVFTDPAHQWVEQNAGKWKGGCPWHESRSGSSFYLDPKTLLWRCSGCDGGGGPLQYLYSRKVGRIASPKGQAFIEAVRDLAALAGVPFPEAEPDEESQKQAQWLQTRQAILAGIYELCRKRLGEHAGREARQYMALRGFTDEDLASLECGLYPTASRLASELTRLGHAKEDVRSAGVLHRRLEGYVVFPWRDERGRPLTLYGTWPGKDPPAGKPKKMSLPNPGGEGDGEELHTKCSPIYLDRALAAGETDLVAVEGLTDAALAQVRGDARVVSHVAGSLSGDQIKTLRRAGVRRLTLCLDPDRAGDNNVAGNVRRLAEAGIRPYVAGRLPDGVDPDDFILAHGIDAWREHVSRRRHGFRAVAEAIIREMGERGPGDDAWADDLVDKAMAEAKKLPADRPDELVEHFLTPIAEAAGRRADDLRERLRLAGSRNGAGNGRPSGASGPNPGPREEASGKKPPPPEKARDADEAAGRAAAGEEGKRRQRSQSAELVEDSEAAELFHDAAGEPYATVPVGEHRETYRLRGKCFRRWLGRAYYERHGRPPGAQAMQDALGVIEGRAVYDGPEAPVAVRIAGNDQAIYLDLADARWRAVEIKPDGWRIVDAPPVKFLRPRGVLPLPEPVRGGSVAELRRHVNAGSESEAGSEANWRLMLAWLLAAFRPRGPYPVLALHGEQGSAKSSTARVLRSLIDPNAAPLRAEPREARDLMIAATNGWVVALDNLSWLQPWLSDALCRLSTGGGFATRELYSDSGETIFEAQRPIILTGIEEVATRSDLLDRSLVLHLPPLPEERCRPEAELWDAFERVRPRVLGALLDVVAAAMRALPSVRMPRLPRMADFAVWATAAESALGWKAGTFLSTYTGNRGEANDLALDASPVAGLLRELADAGGWKGTCSDLLARLSESAGEEATKRPAWPKTPRALGGQLRRLAPNLRRAGIALEMSREPGGKRQRMVHVPKAQNEAQKAQNESASDSPAAAGPKAQNESASDSPDSPDRPDSPDPPGSSGTTRDGRDGSRDGRDGSRDGSRDAKPHDGTVRDGRDGRMRPHSNSREVTEL
jgi:DNA primase